MNSTTARTLAAFLAFGALVYSAAQFLPHDPHAACLEHNSRAHCTAWTSTNASATR